MPDITAASTKAEIITASLEMIDDQQATINRLKEQQLTLMILCGVLASLLIL
jgi:hypothetical protein